MTVSKMVSAKLRAAARARVPEDPTTAKEGSAFRVPPETAVNTDYPLEQKARPAMSECTGRITNPV
jgi:hypothetical protein